MGITEKKEEEEEDEKGEGHGNSSVKQARELPLGTLEQFSKKERKEKKRENR